MSTRSPVVLIAEDFGEDKNIDLARTFGTAKPVLIEYILASYAGASDRVLAKLSVVKLWNSSMNKEKSIRFGSEISARRMAAS